jgi:hypothetical protein
MYTLVDAHGRASEVEPICHLLRISPSSYSVYQQATADPARRAGRRRDKALLVQIARLYHAKYEVYCVRKVWRQLRQDRETVARCIVARLTQFAGLQGVVRGAGAHHAADGGRERGTADVVQRQFTAAPPNQLSVADFTDAARLRVRRLRHRRLLASHRRLARARPRGPT